MKIDKINYIFRSPKYFIYSVEELFFSVSENLGNSFEHEKIFLPNSGASLKSVIKNLLFTTKINGIIHITGEVYYIGLLPFKKTVITIHDVNFIWGSLLKRILLKLFWLIIPSLFANRITVVSEFTKNELLKISPWSKNKIRVIYNPVNPQLETKLKSFSEIPNILHVGTKPNKNLLNTIKGLAGITCNLIIVGEINLELMETLKVNDIKFENHINIKFREIKKLYERADIVSFISLYEGFGMPIIEAQKVGRVVITSTKAAIPEICNNAACFVDPLNVGDINRGFKKLIANAEFRDDLIQKGLLNVSRFDMKTIIKDYKDLYNELK